MYKGNGDICINIKSSEVAPKEPTLYLTNETNADQLDLSKYLGVIWPSQWCVDNIPVNNTTFVLPHGYDSSKIYPSEKFSKQCLYASSPDRGLETLLKVWPDVYKNHPDASLIVTYGAEPQDIPGVMFLGETDEETMNELYKTSDFWTHPCSGGELFGITGIKAQASGCIPVIIPTMALKETVPTGYLAQSVDDYADTLEWALESSTEEKALMRETLAQNHYVDWYESTELLLNIIESVIIN
jgi:glycosyltransferase involved in cell wall biosynthesis